MMPPPFFATIFASTSGAFVDGWPFLSSAQPSGSGFSALLYISSLPRVTTVVEASKKKLYGSAGIAQAMGFEPIMALRPNVGTMIASLFVQLRPIMPSRQAMLA